MTGITRKCDAGHDEGTELLAMDLRRPGTYHEASLPGIAV